MLIALIVVGFVLWLCLRALPKGFSVSNHPEIVLLGLPLALLALLALLVSGLVGLAFPTATTSQTYDLQYMNSLPGPANQYVLEKVDNTYIYNVGEKQFSLNDDGSKDIRIVNDGENNPTLEQIETKFTQKWYWLIGINLNYQSIAIFHIDGNALYVVPESN
jgi:hypothetical protein